MCVSVVGSDLIFYSGLLDALSAAVMRVIFVFTLAQRQTYVYMYIYANMNPCCIIYRHVCTRCIFIFVQQCFEHMCH